MFGNYGELNSTVKFGKTVRKVFADIIFANSSYRHNCVRVGSKAMPLKGFRLELIHSLLGVPRTRSSASGLASLNIVFPHHRAHV